MFIRVASLFDKRFQQRRDGRVRRPDSVRRSIESLEARQLLAVDLLGFDAVSDLGNSSLLDDATVVYSKATRQVHYELPNESQTTDQLTADYLDFASGSAGIELSFPPGFQPNEYSETVHGADDRVRVTNTLVEPFSSIARIESTYSDGGSGTCTGTIIGSKHLLTAGHCVFRVGVGFAQDFDIFPGQDGDVRPFGEVDWQTVRTASQWVNGQDRDFDYAVITLDRSIGTFTGSVRREPFTPSEATNIDVNLIGYAGDLSQGATEMYSSFGPTLGASDYRVFYSGLDGLDSGSGQSGSPLLRVTSQGPTIVGVHTTGGANVNGATLMNYEKNTRINGWMSDDFLDYPPDDRADLVDFDDYFDTTYAVATSASVSPGESWTVAHLVRNNGVVPSGEFDVTYYASTNDTITTGDIELGTLRATSIDPFRGVEVQGTVESFPDLPAGDYYIGWIIDSSSEVYEYDEYNKGILSYTLAVEQPPIATLPVEVFFSAVTSSGQRELHVSDGTTAGTQLFRDLSGGVASNPADFTWVEDKLFFTATMPSGERELFKSFGTPATTSLVRNISGSLSSDPQELTAVGNRLYFTALLPNGQRELFRTRGTSSTTVLVDNLGGARSANPTNLVAVDNQLFFTATTTTGERELHTTFGGRSDTRMVRNLSGGVSSNPSELTRVGNRVFFAATIPSGERELFVSDGTSSGTRLVRNLSGSVSSNPTDLVAMGNRVYFVASLPNGEREMFFSRGSTSNTNLLANLSEHRSSNPIDLVVADDQLFFVATLLDGQKELHVTDGTRSNTKMVRDLSGSNTSRPLQMIPYGRDVFFTVLLPSGERELFRSDGTFLGTQQVDDISGTTSATPRDLVITNDRLFFSARRSDDQRELFVYNLEENQTFLIRNLSGSVSSNPEELTSRPSLEYESFESSHSEALLADLSFADDTDAVYDPADINADGRVTALDALQVVNRLGTQSASLVSKSEASEAGDFEVEDDSEWIAVMDISGDARITALDALMVINRLQAQSQRPQATTIAPLPTGRTETAGDDERTPIESVRGVSNDSSGSLAVTSPSDVDFTSPVRTNSIPANLIPTDDKAGVTEMENSVNQALATIDSVLEQWSVR
ncbi:dockerin type I domain-containing protein [Rubripirellula amarantea]|nr:dockerin type I domain-containing protein [Rubripirellula amarantea]